MLEFICTEIRIGGMHARKQHTNKHNTTTECVSELSRVLTDKQQTQDDEIDGCGTKSREQKCNDHIFEFKFL